MTGRARLLTLVGAVAALAAPAAGFGGSAAAAHPTAAPSRLLVYAQEWALWPSRTRIAAGAVSVQLWNRGQDPHDLRIQRLRDGRPGGRVQGVATVTSGQIADASWRLQPGTYELYCSLAGHAHAGMRTRLVVR